MEITDLVVSFGSWMKNGGVGGDVDAGKYNVSRHDQTQQTTANAENTYAFVVVKIFVLMENFAAVGVGAGWR